MLYQCYSRLLHTFVSLVLLYNFNTIFAPTRVEASPMTNVFINEMHYDNNGADIDEFVEIAGDANVDLTGWPTDFIWFSPQASTFGVNNTGQQFISSNRRVIPVNEPSSLLAFFLVLMSVFLLSKSNSICVDPNRQAVE